MTLTVLEPGGASTVQDRGRPGYQRYGVPEAGAMDQLLLGLANRLVGNDEGEACLEVAMVGGRYQAGAGGCRLAIAGDFDLAVDDTKTPAFRACDVRPGGIVAVGRARSGVYGYLAVAGGFDIPAVLGSRSTHVRSGIGGGFLQPGTVLPLRQGSSPKNAPLALDPTLWPSTEGPIRVIMGPQDDHFTTEGRAAFLSGPYRISLQSDRMGFRLEGPPIAHLSGFNIVSDGIALGSIQVPGTGQPIVLLADRQSTGGYPKIATVVSPDIRRLVQRGAGPVRFVAVTPQETDAALREEQAAAQRLFEAIRPASQAGLLSSERLLGLNLVDGFVSG